MSTAAAIVVAAVALACPLHMLWRMRQGRRACQRALAERVESRARRGAAPERH